MRLKTHRFLLAVGLVLITLVTLPSARSQTEGDLLSYSELMRLPQAKRIAYIAGVRTILVELSKDPEARFSDSDPRARSKLKVWLEFMEQNILSEALAADNSSDVSNDGLCISNDFCKSAMRSCFDQGQGIIWQENIGTYRCDPSQKIEVKSKSGRSAFARVNERAFFQYASQVADPRSDPRSGPRSATSSEVRAEASADAAPAFKAISIVRPPVAVSTSTKSLLQTVGVASAPKRPGAQAKSIEEFVELLALGKIKGKRYNCRSKHLMRTFLNDKGEIVNDSSLKECTEDEENKIQAYYDRVRPTSLILEKADVSSSPTSASSAADSPASASVSAPATTSSSEAPNIEPAPASATTYPVAQASALTETFGRRISREEIQPFLGKRESPDLVCEAERKTLGDGKLVFMQMAKDGSFGRCMSEANAKLFANGGLKPHPDDEESASSQPTAVGASVSPSQPSVDGNNGKFAACAPKPESCGDRAAVRKAYYQGKLPCVFAGMISNLDGENRRCQAVTEYKVGGENLKCDTGQAMCNPLLFGTVLGSSPTKAICVGRGQDVTIQCGKLSNARDAELFINRNAVGLQEKWDEFKTNLESVCKPQTVSGKFHCQECNTMRQRLFDLHARLVGNPCETNLDQGIKTRIHIRSRATKK